VQQARICNYFTALDTEAVCIQNAKEVKVLTVAVGQSLDSLFYRIIFRFQNELSCGGWAVKLCLFTHWLIAMFMVILILFHLFWSCPSFLVYFFTYKHLH